MKRLNKKAVRETKITNLINVDNDNIVLEDDVLEFFENSLLETIRSVAVDDKNGTMVIHCVLDRAEFEQYVGFPVDDATCKVVSKALMQDEFLETIKDQLEKVASDLKHNATPIKIDLEFGDGVFHTIALLAKS